MGSLRAILGSSYKKTVLVYVLSDITLDIDKKEKVKCSKRTTPQMSEWNKFEESGDGCSPISKMVA